MRFVYPGTAPANFFAARDVAFILSSFTVTEAVALSMILPAVMMILPN